MIARCTKPDHVVHAVRTYIANKQEKGRNTSQIISKLEELEARVRCLFYASRSLTSNSLLPVHQRRHGLRSLPQSPRRHESAAQPYPARVKALFRAGHCGLSHGLPDVSYASPHSSIRQLDHRLVLLRAAGLGRDEMEQRIWRGQHSHASPRPLQPAPGQYAVRGAFPPSGTAR